MNVSFCIFRRVGRNERWTLIAAHGHELSRAGRSAPKLEHHFREDLRKLLHKTEASSIRSLERPVGLELRHVRLELTIEGETGRREVRGRCPVVLEPRQAGGGRELTLVYHPERKEEWFVLEPDQDLEAQSQRYFQRAWRTLEDYEVEELFSRGREQLHTISISGAPAEPKLKKKREREGLERQREPVLTTLATDRTEALESKHPDELGVTRAPHRQELSSLLSGARKRSTLVVGDSGSGRTTLLDQAVWDLLVADDFPSHRNLDLVHHVYQLSARSLIAGMSFAGDWEKRCFDLIREARKKGAILWFVDLATFGRTGRSRQSDRSFADVFRGPIARGEVVVIGELTPSELARLEEDAPGFPSLFARVSLPAASADETFRLVLREARLIEARLDVRFDPAALPVVVDLADSLVSGRCLPGAALDWLRRLARSASEDTEIKAGDVLSFVAGHTGLSRSLLDPSHALDGAEVIEVLGARVLGQPHAVEAMADVVLRIKAGMTDNRRPYGVLLLAGPTGTGKTELAKALAAYLYGSEERLLRLDMGEYTSPDAVVRLIGDSYGAEGVLTRALTEQPFAVVLLDEIEKAHSGVFPLLLQILDEGRLTAADGKRASFRNAVVVLTSNLGARSRPAPGFGAAAASSDTMRAIREFFAPEFVNRIDKVVAFSPLSLEHAHIIVGRELGRLFTRPGLRDRNAVVITDRSAVEHIAKTAFRSEGGARSLRRFLEDHVASVLADTIARAPDAAFRIVRLYAGEYGFRVEEYRLLEAAPLDARFPLEEILRRPLRDSQERLTQARRALEAMLDSPALPELADHLGRALREHMSRRRSRGAELYSIERLRRELEELCEELTRLSRSPEEIEREESEREADFVVAPGMEEAPEEILRVRSRNIEPRVPLRNELMRTFARVSFMRRTLRRVSMEGLHAVSIELAAVSPHRVEHGLVQWLAQSYARAHGELDSFAVHAGGEVRTGDTKEELDAALEHKVSTVVLRIVGPAVRDFFELEDGMHMLVPSSRDAQLVRVRVAAALQPADLEARARAMHDEMVHLGAREVFDAPLVRLVRFEPPHRTGATSVLEIEDYRHAYVACMRVAQLDQALAQLWLVRLSREDVMP